MHLLPYGMQELLRMTLPGLCRQTAAPAAIAEKAIMKGERPTRKPLCGNKQGKVE